MEYEKKRKIWGLLSAAAVLCWTFYIWSNSMEPGTQSMQRSQNVVEIVKPVLTTLQISRSSWQLVVRKSAHFLEFAVLGVMWLWPLSLKYEKYMKISGLALLFSVLTASMDEIIQLTTSARSSQLQDVLIDSAGAFTGICIGVLILWGFSRVRQIWKRKKA